jgi:drug/metabolite transporter (DMT)-like permease
LILICIMVVRKERLPLDRRSISIFLTLGFLSFSLPFAMIYWAEQYIPSSLASILFAIYPFVVAIGSHVALSGERFTTYKISGITLGFAGILIIFWEDIHIRGVSGTAMGAVLLSTVFQGISLVMVKKFGKHLSPVALNVGGMLAGIVVMYAIALVAEDFSALRFDAKGVGSLLYLGTFGTVATFMIYYWLLKRVEAVYLSLVSFVTPVLAVILGVVLLHEALGTQMFTGASLVLVGILVANGKDVLTNLNLKRENDNK